MNGRRETGEVPVRANQHRKLIWNPKIKARVEKMQREVFQDTRFMVNDPKPEPEAGKLARPVPTSSGCGYPLTLEGEGPRSGPKRPWHAAGARNRGILGDCPILSRFEANGRRRVLLDTKIRTKQT